jgi:uncharacterized membrane protein YphA (DoxX/SURF4 family)
MRSKRKASRVAIKPEQQATQPFNGPRGMRKGMSEAGLGAVLLIIGTVMLVISFWRQIIAFVLVVFLTVFCCGVYYIVVIIENLIN